jgi:hypothetical protein
MKRHQPTRRFYTSVWAMGLVYLAIACSPVEHMREDFELAQLESPASGKSGMPNLTKGQDGNIYLSWVETNEDGIHALKFSKWDGDGWGSSETISSGDHWFVNWADFPAMAVFQEQRMAANWLQKSGDGTFDYDIRWKFKKGDLWSESLLMNTDSLKAEHGFVSLLPTASGELFSVWLDGRSTVTEDEPGQHNHDDHGHKGQMSLRAAVFSQNEFDRIQEWELDNRVCDCCQTAATETNDGLVVLYRDRSDNEIRDIYIMRYEQREWSEPKPLHEDGWKIAGCPVNGPSLSSIGNQVVAAWFTGAHGEIKVQAKSSTDGGKTFGEVILLNDYPGPGRVHTVAIPERNTFVVIWLENIPKRGTILKAAELTAKAELLRKWDIIEGTESRAGGFPRLAYDGEKLLFAWTDDREGSRKLMTAFQKIN